MEWIVCSSVTHHIIMIMNAGCECAFQTVIGLEEKYTLVSAFITLHLLTACNIYFVCACVRARMSVRITNRLRIGKCQSK